jgi:putative SOS response-associated peptidase YedK
MQPDSKAPAPVSREARKRNALLRAAFERARVHLKRDDLAPWLRRVHAKASRLKPASVKAYLDSQVHWSDVFNPYDPTSEQRYAAKSNRAAVPMDGFYENAKGGSEQ